MRYVELTTAAYTAKKYEALEFLLAEWRDLSLRTARGLMYPESVHMTHNYRGLIALERGDVETATIELLKSARVPRSAILGVVGPNMQLAKELLERGERQVVLEYLHWCRKFWLLPFRFRKLRRWKAEIYAGKVPNFGTHLIYHRGRVRKNGK